MEKFSFNEVKIEKVKLFTQNPAKTFCITPFFINNKKFKQSPRKSLIC